MERARFTRQLFPDVRDTDRDVRGHNAGHPFSGTRSLRATEVAKGQGHPLRRHCAAPPQIYIQTQRKYIHTYISKPLGPPKQRIIFVKPSIHLLPVFLFAEVQPTSHSSSVVTNAPPPPPPPPVDKCIVRSLALEINYPFPAASLTCPAQARPRLYMAAKPNACLLKPAEPRPFRFQFHSTRGWVRRSCRRWLRS